MSALVVYFMAYSITGIYVLTSTGHEWGQSMAGLFLLKFEVDVHYINGNVKKASDLSLFSICAYAA